jgi:hypothetical protein
MMEIIAGGAGVYMGKPGHATSPMETRKLVLESTASAFVVGNAGKACVMSRKSLATTGPLSSPIVLG